MGASIMAAGHSPASPAKQFGPIRLIRPIGKGAMGEVWLARHEFLGRDVAVKILSQQLRNQTDTAVSEFVDGAQVAASVEHPGLNKVHHADVADGTPYLVLEFLDGSNLHEVLERSGRLDLASARAVIEAMTEAVAELHKHDLAHRDLKPSNLVLTSDGRIVVTDFGLACVRSALALRGNSGIVAGTPAYMAPEMFDGVVSARTDVYAIGMTAYRLLAGRPAFDGTLDEVKRQHQTVAIDVEPLRAAGVPDGVIDTIVRATSKDILFRPKTARHLLDAFRAAFDAAGIQTASRDALRRLLREHAPTPADQAHAGAAGTMAETVSQLAARKRELHSGGKIADPISSQHPLPDRGNSMSEQPPPIPDPLPPADPHAHIPMAALACSAPAYSQRPGSLKAVAVISIVLSCLSALVCLGAGVETFGFFIIAKMSSQMAATSVPTSNPALTVAQAGQVVARVQGMVGNAMTPAQVHTLTAELQRPNQPLLSSQYLYSPIQSATRNPDGTLVIFFQSGTAHNFGGATMILTPTGKSNNLATPFGPGGNPFGNMKLNPAVIAFAIFEDAASFGLAIYLFVAGILLLRDSPNSRKRHLRYAAIKCVLATMAAIATYLLFNEFYSAIMPNRAGAAIAASVEVIIFSVLGFAYPVALFITMNTKSVRRHYAVAR
jgi:serine/threonine protein kinase